MAPFILTLVFGLWGIRRQGGIWDDEAMTYDAAHRSLPHLFHLLRHADVVHGAYYLFMHVVFSVHPGGLVALRLPSVVAMCLAATGVALIGDRLVGPRAGLLAGLVFPLPAVPQWFEQDGRSYAIVCALITWSTWLLVLAMERSRARTWIGYAVVSLLACLFHEFAVLAIVAHGLALLLTGIRGRLLAVWAAVAGAVIVVLAPFAAFSTTQSKQVSWITTPGWQNLYEFPWLMGIGLVCALIPLRHRGAVKVWALALPMLFVPTLLLILVTFTVKPVYVDRYVLYSVIGYALPTGAALDEVWRRADRGVWSRVLLAAGAVVVAVVIGMRLAPSWSAQREATGRDNDLAAAARTVGGLAAPGEGVLFVPKRLRLAAQVHPGDFRGLTDVALARSAVASNTRYGDELPPDGIRRSISAAQRLIVLSDDPPRDQSDDRIAQETVKWPAVRAGFQQCTVRQVVGVRIAVYARPGAC